MVRISGVEKNSIACRAGIETGDRLLGINGRPVRDYIDFMYETADDFFILTVEKMNEGQVRDIEIERRPGERLGIELNGIIYDNLKKCSNNCIFCFIDQQPPGLRTTLNIKDDDYRFSFLQGSYITLTNLKEQDFKRIIDYRLSPLYISVHTTDPVLRRKMLRNKKAGEIMDQLKRLAEAGIKLNTQVVLCPGINDNQELERTITDLFSLYPALNSLGIVPVGLTGHREDCYNLQAYDSEKARGVLQKVNAWQEKITAKTGENWLYAADEFYLLADRDIPDYGHYGSFPQLENGIGLTRKLWQELDDLKSKLARRINGGKYAIVTGELGCKVLQPAVSLFNEVKGLQMELLPVENKFFGSRVTVTGLLTAGDIIDKLSGYDFTDNILVPAAVLNDKGYFLDGYTFKETEKILRNKNLFLCSNLRDVLEVIGNG